MVVNGAIGVRISIGGETMYLTDVTGLGIYDISNPASPRPPFVAWSPRPLARRLRRPVVAQLDRRHPGLVGLLERARQEEDEGQRREHGDHEEKALGGHRWTA